MDRVLTVYMALRHSAAHSPQWSGVRGGAPSDRGASVTFSPSSLTMKDLGIIQSGFDSNKRFHFASFFTEVGLLSSPCER